MGYDKIIPFYLGVALIRGAIGVDTSLGLFLLNECLLIVQGQRQHINGPRIKWQQRGVVEHNPS